MNMGVCASNTTPPRERKIKQSKNSLSTKIERAVKTRQLNLEGFNISELPKAVFEKCRTIKTLTISGTKINTLSGFGCFTDLRTLKANHCRLTSKSFEGVELTNLVRLETLELNGNGVSAIPAGVFKLPKLKRISLQKNNMQNISDTPIGHVSTLQIIDLSNNDLATVPDSIGRLTNLKEIYLQGNSIVSLPDSMGELKSLMILNVDGNDLTTLPVSLLKDTPVYRIELAGNPVYETKSYVRLEGFEEFSKRHKQRYDKGFGVDISSGASAMRTSANLM